MQLLTVKWGRKVVIGIADVAGRRQADGLQYLGDDTIIREVRISETRRGRRWLHNRRRDLRHVLFARFWTILLGPVVVDRGWTFCRSAQRREIECANLSVVDEEITHVCGGSDVSASFPARGSIPLSTVAGSLSWIPVI